MKLPSLNDGPVLCALCDDMLNLLYDYHMRTLDTAAIIEVGTGVKRSRRAPQLEVAYSVVHAISKERSIRAKLRGSHDIPGN